MLVFGDNGCGRVGSREEKEIEKKIEKEERVRTKK